MLQEVGRQVRRREGPWSARGRGRGTSGRTEARTIACRPCRRKRPTRCSIPTAAQVPGHPARAGSPSNRISSDGSSVDDDLRHDPPAHRVRAAPPPAHRPSCRLRAVPSAAPAVRSPALHGPSIVPAVSQCVSSRRKKAPPSSTRNRSQFVLTTKDRPALALHRGLGRRPVRLDEDRRGWSTRMIGGGSAFSPLHVGHALLLGEARRHARFRHRDWTGRQELSGFDRQCRQLLAAEAREIELRHR